MEEKNNFKENKQEIVYDRFGNSYKTKNYTKPWLGVIICFGLSILYIFILNLTGFLVGFFSDSSDYYSVPAVLVQLIATLFLLVYTNFFHLKGILKEKGIGFGKSLLVAGFYSFLIFVLIYDGYYVTIHFYAKGNDFLPVSKIILFVVSMFLVGLSEEWMFRGIILNLLYRYFGNDTKKGIRLSVLFSGIIFGSMHIFNFFSGVSLKGAFFQTMAAIGIGCYFGAIYARTNNIWLLIILHGLNDFLLDLKSGLFGMGSMIEDISNYTSSSLVGMALYFSLAFFLLRSKKLDPSPEQN